MSSHDIYYITVADTTEFESQTGVIGNDMLGVLRHIFGTTRVDKLGDNVLTIQGGIHGPVDVDKLQTARDTIPNINISTTPPIDRGVRLVDSDDDVSLASIDYKIDDRLIYLHIESKDSSQEMQRFFVDFLGRSRQSEESGEIVVLGRLGNSVCGFYGVLPPAGDIIKDKLLHRIRARLQKRKLLAMENDKHRSIREKYLDDHNIIRTTVLKDYNTFLSKAGECVLTSAQGISLEKIRLCLHSNPHYVEPSLTVQKEPSLRTARSASTRKTAEEVDADVRAKIDDFVERINRFVPIEEQVRTKFEFNGDTINELVASRVFMTCDRAFLRSNRSLIHDLIDQNIRQFKESEPAEAKAKRLKTEQDGRRALAESYAQKIREYCAPRVDEHGFCNLDHAYTYKILRIFEDKELITDAEVDEARTVKKEIDELLLEARTENDKYNKGDLNKAKELGRRLLEIFLLEFDRFERSDFRSDPRGYVQRNVYENNNVVFGDPQRLLFNGIHHGLILTTIWSEYHKVERAMKKLLTDEQLRWSLEVEGPVRELHEESQRVKRAANRKITEFVKRVESHRIDSSRGKGFRLFTGTYNDKYEKYKRDPTGFTSEQIAIFKEGEELALIQQQLFEEHNVQTVEELKTKIQPLEEYKRDLTLFTPPTEDEVREYIRANFTAICDAD
jgi:hypothetical protein